MLALAAMTLATGFQAYPHSKVDLVAAQRVMRPGSSVVVALRFRMDPGWHVYWQNPGESGLAPKINWHLPKGWKAGPLQWPVPERIETGGVVNYAYEKEVWLLTRITSPRNATGTSAALKGDVSWLCCQQACIPCKASVSATVHLGRNEIADSKYFDGFRQADSRIPRSVTGIAMTGQLDGKEIRLTLRGSVPYATAAKPIFFCSDDTVEPSGKQTTRPVSGGIEMTLKVSPYVSQTPTRLRGLVLPQDSEEPTPGTKAVPVDIPLVRSTK